MIAVGKVFVIMNWDNVDASMDLVVITLLSKNGWMVELVQFWALAD